MELLNRNAVNQIPQGTVIFRESEAAECIAIVLRGRIQIKNRGSSVLAGVGTFFGMSDVMAGRYQSSYIAYDNVIVYVFEMKDYEDLSRIAGENKDYGGLIVTSQCRYLKEMDRIRGLLNEEARGLFEFLSSYSKKCTGIGRKSGYLAKDIECVGELKPYKNTNDIDEELLEYNKQCCTLPINIMKEYYSNNVISTYQVKQQVPLIHQMVRECTRLSSYIFELFMSLFCNGNECLFQIVVNLLFKLKDQKEWKQTLSDIAEKCIEKINQTEKLLHDELNMDLNVNHEYLEQIYYQIISGDLEEKKERQASVEDAVDDNAILAQTSNSLNKILQYASMAPDETEEWMQLMDTFLHMGDKGATDDDARKLRRRIAEKYYTLYYKVFLTAHEKNDESILINLFLNYGLLDERLLTQEQIIMLYHLDKGSIEHESCCVYNMREWLTEIYEGRKSPSKSEFDLDYDDALRERKRVEKLSDAQMKELSEDKDAKLRYELNNMLKYNNRISSGRISSFVPFLYKDIFYSAIEKMFHSADEINAAINRLMSVDFSIFCREVLYYDIEKGIKKEYIIKKVFPDVILLPVSGSVGVMWQEITGRKRDTPGRFLIPILLEENLDDIIVQLFGRFRWEICRTEQGTAWNNIQYPSLTSEYYDYIQFYQKNRDLTPEKKEKLKSQITRGRGNMREVFLIDYISWITREYKGEVRLNKVARAILATYIPFRQDLREKIMGQPMFQDAMNRYEKNRKHTVREMELRIRSLEKDGVEIPDALMDTFEYWNEA